MTIISTGHTLVITERRKNIFFNLAAFLWRLVPPARSFVSGTSYTIELKGDHLFINGTDHGNEALIQVTAWYTTARPGRRSYTIFLRSPVANKLRVAAQISQKDALVIRRYFEQVLKKEIEFRYALWI